jgi:hypothetical protein
MNSALNALFLFGALIAVMWLGRTLRRHLPGAHLSADSKDAVKLAVGLVATMTALLEHAGERRYRITYATGTTDHSRQ